MRLPAEWEDSQGVLIAWPHAATDWEPMLDRVERCYIELASAIARYTKLIIIAPDIAAPLKALKEIDRGLTGAISLVEVPTNDTWTRDYGPITTQCGASYSINDFKFNGWGLKFAADKDNLATRALFAQSPLYRNHLSFVLEGGSIESDGQGTLLTTTRCLMSANRNGGMSREEIESYLQQALGAKKILWLDYGALEGDDTDSHIDTLARLAPDNTILYVKCEDPTDSHYGELNRMESQLGEMTNCNGTKFRLLPLPMPSAIYDEDGNRLPATYANYLLVPNAVFVPTYGQPDKDQLAITTIAKAFAGREIVGVDCRALIEQHGSLHCATMQLPVLP